MTEQSPNQQPSQPQQPGGYQQPAEGQYSGAPYQQGQQQYASPQAQYQAQQAQYAQYQQGSAGQMLDNLPFNTMTAGLAGGGLVAMVVAVLLAASGEGPAVGLVFNQINSLETPFLATLVVTALTLALESARLRVLFRMILLGLAGVQVALALGVVIASDESAASAGISDQFDNNAAAVIGMLLYLAAVGLLVASAFTVSKQPTPGVPATPQPQGPYAQPGQTGQQPQVQQTQTQWPQAPQA